MTPLRIYGIARTRAFRALWIAKELGLDYEHIPIEIGDARRAQARISRHQSERPAAGDRRRRLRALGVARDHALSRQEARAGSLYPATLEGEAKAWQWSLWSVQEVDRGVNIWSLHAVRLPPEDRDPQRLAEALKVLEPPFRVLDGALAGSPYLLGDDFTVADLNVAAVISRAIDMDLAARRRISAPGSGAASNGRRRARRDAARSRRCRRAGRGHAADRPQQPAVTTRKKQPFRLVRSGLLTEGDFFGGFAARRIVCQKSEKSPARAFQSLSRLLHKRRAGHVPRLLFQHNRLARGGAAR